MIEFSELERELRRLRPAQPSGTLFERVSEALEKSSGASVSHPRLTWLRFAEWSRRGARERERTSQIGHNWMSLGFGVAAAALLVLLAAVTLERRQEQSKTVAQSSRPPSETQRAPSALERSNSRSRFVPAGGMNVLYNARDEGLHFADGSERPLRRVRYNTQQTWRWRNPETGASLRVSYPSEEVVLIPVSGQ